MNKKIIKLINTGEMELILHFYKVPFVMYHI